jgi:hypothetical protein
VVKNIPNILESNMTDTKIPYNEEITVEMDFPPIQLPGLFPDLKPTVTFTGKVIPSAEYDPRDSLRMTGDQSCMHVRVISFNKLLKLNGKKFKYTPSVEANKPQAPKTVKVAGSKPGVFYTLTIKADGSKGCSCPGYGFRGTCRHIDNYKA